MMQHPEIAIDMFKQHLPENLLDMIDLGTLKPIDKEFIHKSLRKRLIDKLFEVRIKGEAGYVYILADHQRSADPMMGWRLLRYIIDIMDRHLERYKTKTLPIVYPIVFYNGVLPFNTGMDIFKQFGSQTEFAKQLYRGPFQLVNLNNIEDDAYREHLWSAILGLPMKWVNHYQTIDSIPRELLKKVFKAAREMGYGSVDEFCLYYLSIYLEVSDEETFLESFNEDIQVMEGETVGYIHQKLRESHEQGMQQGWRQGRKQRSLEIARGCLNQGLAIDVIANITELTIADVKQLQQETTIDS